VPDAETSALCAPSWRLPPVDHRLTPRWIALACVVAGERPPVIDGGFQMAVLGARTGELAVEIAVSHPEADVWAWDPAPANVEATRRLRDDAGVANLRIHERPGLPADLGGGTLDLVIVDQVLELVDDALRDQIVLAIAENLRPGGAVCVRYHTVIGWTEISPVLALMRHVARCTNGDIEARVVAALDLLRTLRDGDAKYLTTRPVVAAWIDSLIELDPATIHDVYLAEDLRPLSHAQVAAAMDHIGCLFIGSARLADELDADMSVELAQQIAEAPTRMLQETYRDLAVRRTDRIDVFRMASSPLTANERTQALKTLAPNMLAPNMMVPTEWSSDQVGTLRLELEQRGAR